MLDTRALNTIALLRRNLWLIILAAILAGAASYAFSGTQSQWYEAETRLFIGNILDEANPQVGNIELGARLAVLYAELSRNLDQLSQIIETLGLDITPIELADQISTRVIPDTPILVLTIGYGDSETAAAVANEIAQSLLRNSPSNLTEEQQAQLILLANQIQDLENQISITRAQSLEVLERLNEATAARDRATATPEGIQSGMGSILSNLGNPVTTQDPVAQLTAEYNSLVDRLNSSRATLAQLSENLLSLSSRSNRVEIIQAARVDATSSLSPLIVTIAGAFVGTVIAVSAVLFLDYINDTIDSTKEAQSVLNLPILSTVSRQRFMFNPRSFSLMRTKPRSKVAEQFRSLRTNLLYASANNRANLIYMVASASPREGRTFVLVNLALAMVETGANVLLIDGNLRNPKLHRVFELPNDRGLVPALTSSQTNPELFEEEHNELFLDVLGIQEVPDVAHLHVITSGSEIKGLSANIFGFERMKEIIDHALELRAFDYVLLDTSASLRVADTYTLAAKTGAQVVMLIEAGRTKHEDALQMREQFHNIKVPLAGMVLNKT